MKKFFYIFFALSFLMFSCNEEKPVQQQFSDEELLSLFENSDLGNNVLLFNSKDNQSDFSIVDGWEYGWLEDTDSNSSRLLNELATAEKHECEGSGIGFAKCVNKVLDSGKCLKVYKQGDTYYAD